MAPMKREQQWDMFDVATGACELDDYLNQRYSENDLQSKFWVEEKDQVDELRPPAQGSKEQVVIPIQGPNVGPPKPPAPVDTAPLPSRPSWEASAPAEALPSRPSWEPPSAPNAPTAAPWNAPARPAPAPVTPAPRPVVSEAPPAAPAWEPPTAPPPAPPAAVRPAPEPEPPAPAAPPSMAELLAQFHQATKAYEERAKDEEPDEP